MRKWINKCEYKTDEKINNWEYLIWKKSQQNSWENKINKWGNEINNKIKEIKYDEGK